MPLPRVPSCPCIRVQNSRRPNVPFFKRFFSNGKGYTEMRKQSKESDEEDREGSHESHGECRW